MKKYGDMTKKWTFEKFSRNYLIPAFAIAALQACAPHHMSNHAIDNYKSPVAANLSMGLRGNFQIQKTSDATNVKASDVFANGCSSAGTSSGIAQIDSRLVVGDVITEDFEDSGLEGLHRSFQKREQVVDLDSASLNLKTVGQIQTLLGATGSLEYTRLCTTTPATSSASQQVSCVSTPSALTTAAMDESEPCAYIPSVTQISRTRGNYAPPGATTTVTVVAFQIKAIEKGELNCGNLIYHDITRSTLEIVSNDIPSIETSQCGGTVTYRFVSYKDSAGKVYYNSRREVTLASRFSGFGRH